MIVRVHLHRRQSCTGHSEAMRKALDTLRQLIPLLKTSPPQRSKLFLYKSYVRPQMTYASPAYAFITKTQLARLQVVQNMVLRVIGVYDRHTRTDKMHLDFKIPTFKSYIKTLVLKMYASACVLLLAHLGTLAIYNCMRTWRSAYSRTHQESCTEFRLKFLVLRTF